MSGGLLCTGSRGEVEKELSARERLSLGQVFLLRHTAFVIPSAYGISILMP